ncbi:MAG: endopeptidase La [Chloroflexota bacterium]|nr:MAG: endopeptidase La [Chloroflexota bacterium]
MVRKIRRRTPLIERNGKQLIVPEVVPILPVKDIVVFPRTLTPLAIGQPRSLRLIESASAGDRLVGLVSQIDSQVASAGPEDVYDVGTLAEIEQILKMPDGTIRVMLRGLEKIRTLEYTQREPILVARIEVVPEVEGSSVEVEALSRNALTLFQKFVELSPYLSEEAMMSAMNTEGPLSLAYFIASSLQLDVPQAQGLLELDSVDHKLRHVTVHLNREIQILELGQQIQSSAAEQMNKAQKEYLLREQIKAIQRELGEEEGAAAQVSELRRRIEAANLPDEARKEAERELERLEKLPEISPEHNVIRTYLEWMADLPWNKSTGAPIDIARARQVLDEDHYDLTKVKERILEYLAVRKLRHDRDAAAGAESALHEPILCFVGPPGVGKTSLGQSIARALQRKFVRMSLGGVRDEAEIRGHRRTYVGALPGRFIQAIRRAETNDPVMMLDEVDKVGADWRGDPTSALLEVLDPEQNREFRDNYLDVSFDLSRVMFITTANTLETIPPALLDRMEVLSLPGYTEEEKVRIARTHLLPKQLKAHGLAEEELQIDDEALRRIVGDYTREAGVRNLEREIATICRKMARDIAEAKAERVLLTADQVRSYLGRPRFFAEVAERTDRPGVATGLAWTSVGGDIMFVEATLMPGRKMLKLTGQMGDVMRESAEAALSFVRSEASELGMDPEFFEQHDIHVHVPAGAVPKDGPSAGITIATALASLLTGRPVHHDLAMTGEITLRGKVLPIGGVKEKVLAAHRAGIKTIILPRRNEGDLEDLPEELRKEMSFVLVDSVDEVLDAALEGGWPGQEMPEFGRAVAVTKPRAA